MLYPCQETERSGYEDALINVGFGEQRLMTDYRRSKRCILDDKEKAAWLWQRIKEFIPATWRSYPVVGLNERLRFLKYNPGYDRKRRLNLTELSYP